MRNDECMVRLLSECAALHWHRIYKYSDNVTRIDLQITFDIGEDPQPIIWNCFKEANNHSAKRKRGPKNDCVLGSDGGATLYCGKRTSNVFGRVYARGPKTKLEADRNVLRFEVQFNKRLALLVARGLAEKKGAATYIDAQVVRFFAARGLYVPIPTTSIPNNCLPRQRTDLQRRLSWLERSARQSCMMLAERGHLEDLIRGLGLEEFVTINHRS